MKRDDALIAELADLNAYIAAIHRVSAEWEQDEIADQMEIRPHVEHEIQDWILRQLIYSMQIYFKKSPVPMQKIHELIGMCRRCIKPKMGSSVRLSEILAKWVEDSGANLATGIMWENAAVDAYPEKQIYGEIAAASIALSCDLFIQWGVWVIRNAEWKTE